MNTDTCLLSVVKVPILQHLESLRDEELEERREKRRKQLAEEEESKQNERRASGAEQAREQSLQVGKNVHVWWFCKRRIFQTLKCLNLLQFVFTCLIVYIFPQGSGLATVNGAENTAGIYNNIDCVFVNLCRVLTHLGDVHPEASSQQSVLRDEVVVCIVLGSHQIWEITIQSTVFPMVMPYQLDSSICCK